MKTAGLLLAFTLLLICSTNAVAQKRSKTYRVSGEVKFSSLYQGGVDLGDVVPIESALINQEFILVKLDSLTGKPHKVDKFSTDAEGKFKLKLATGIYGFVLKENLKDLQMGQFTPTTEVSGGQWETKSVNWNFIGMKPIIVEDASVENIRLLRHTSTICHECP